MKDLKQKERSDPVVVTQFSEYIRAPRAPVVRRDRVLPSKVVAARRQGELIEVHRAISLCAQHGDVYLKGPAQLWAALVSLV